MANRYDIIHIDFQASARGANAAIESIRKEAEESSKKIEQLKKDLEAATKGGDTYTADLIKGNLRGEEKRLRQLTQAQNELIKGMRVLDQAVKQFNDGSLQEMNAAFQKSAYNAAKLAQSKMQTGTKEWREMGAVMQETEQNYTRMQRDTDQLIEHLKNGGTVFRKTLEDEKKGLQDLLQVLPYMGVEYRKAEEQLKFLTKTTDDMLIKERQLKGEIVTTDDARRESLKLTQEGAEAARRQGEAAEKEIGWRTKVAEVLDKQRQSQEQLAKQSAQEVADNIERLQEYEDVIEGAGIAIKETQDKIKGKQDKADRLESDADIAYRQYLDLQKKRDEATKNDTQATKENTEATEKNAEANKKQTDETKETTEAIKDKEAETQKLIQLQKELDEAMAKAGYKGKDADNIDLQASLNRSARVGLNNVQLTSRTWKNRFDDNASFEDWVKGYVGAEESDKFWVATAKDKIKNTMSSFLGGDKSLEDLKKFKEEWDKVAQGFLSEPKTSKGYYMEAINYIDNLIDKTVQLKEVEEKRAAVRNQKAVVDGINQETQATNENAAAEDKSTESKKKKTKATKEDTKAKKENAEASKEEAEGEDKVAEAKKRWEVADRKAQRARNDANKAIEEGNKTIEETNALIDDTKNKQAQLEKQQEKSVATNKRNQDMLAKTTEMQQQNGEAMQQAELKKIQAQGLTMKQLETIIALYKKQHDEELEANTDAWREKGAEIERLTKILNEWKGAPVLQMMTERMKNVGSLSAAAVTETRKFWETMVAGAEQGSESLKEAEAHLKTITKEEEKRTREKNAKLSDRLIGNRYLTLSESDIRESIEAAREYQKTLAPTEDIYKRISQQIAIAEEYIRKFGVEAARSTQKQMETDALMRQQLQQGTSLSESALEAQEKYWRRLIDDPKTAKESLEVYKKELETVYSLQKQQSDAAIQKNAARLNGGALSMYSEAEISEAIKAAKELHSHMASADPAAQKLAESIAKAEAHIRQYGIEAARTAQRQEELDATMQKQFQTMINGMRSGVMPSQAAVKSQMNYWQKLIDDPKTAAESLQFYRDQLAEVKKMYDFMIKSQGESALAWFQQGSDKDASGNQIKEMADKLKEYRGTLLKETNADEIAQIDAILQRIGASAKKATEDMMEFEKAKELALQAGDDVYGKNNPAFLASPEEIQAATKSIEKYREELFKTIKQKKDMGEATDDEEAELQELAKYLKDLKFEQDNFNMSREKMEALMKTPVSATSIDELRAAIKRADAELKRMEGSLGQNNAQYKAFAEQVRNAKNQLKEMEGQAKASATAWEKAWSRLKTYVVMYMGFNAVWQKMVGTADDLMQLSDKMGEVRKTTGFTADEVGRLSDNLKRLDVRTSLTQLMEISAKAGQLGLKAEQDVMGFTEAANKLMIALPEMGAEAATEMMKVAIATGEVKRIQDQLNKGLIEGSSATEVALSKVGSVIDQLRANSAAAAPQITDFVKRVGAVGAQSGISIDQVAALGATVDALGLRVEMSATALSRMIPAIRNNAFEVAKAIGMTPNALREMFDEAGGGMEAMLAIFQHIKDSGMDEDSIEKMLGIGNMQDVMKQLNQQGARAGIVFAGLSQNVDELRRNLGVAKEAYEDNVAILQEYNKMNDTTAAKWERFKNQLEEFFVGDFTQRFLGGIIDFLRLGLDFLTGNNGWSAAFRTIGVYLLAIKLNIAGIFSGVKNISFSLKGIAMAIGLIDKETKKLAWGNIFTAAAAAILWVVLELKNLKSALDKASDSLAETKEEINRSIDRFEGYWAKLKSTSEALNQAKASHEKLSAEVDKLRKSTDGSAESTANLKKKEDELTTSEKNVTKASNDHKSAIAQMNSIYGKYLGFILTEANYSNLAADAHDKVTAAIEREMLMKQRQAAIGEVDSNYSDNIATGYGDLNERLVQFGKLSRSEAAKAMSDMQRFMRENLKYDAGSNATVVSKAIMDQLKRNGLDVSKADANEIAGLWFDQYLKENYHLSDKVRRGLTGVERRSDQKEGWSNVYTPFATNLRGGYAETYAQREQARGAVSAVYNVDIADSEGREASASGKLLSNLEKSAQNAKKVILDKNVDEKKRNEAYGELANALEGLDNRINELDPQKDAATINRLNSLATSLKGEGIDIKKLKQAREKIHQTLFERATFNEEDIRNLNTTNPWGGGHDAASTDWKNMTAEQLVARRKQMKEFVNSIQTDSDVKTVLGEDAALKKAIEKGMSSDMRTVIEWYNTERLKIQDELHARHLTNTGDWMDPKKQRGAHKQFRDEMDAYLHELDAYYTERKTRIEEAGTDEGLTEAEIKNRTLNNEMEWQQRRAELQKLYSRKQKEVTEEELNAIYHIIAERTGDSESFVKAQIAKTNQFVDSIEKSGEKGAAIVHRWMSQVELDTERSYLKGQQALTKQMRAIEAIIDKERPFNGITKSLQESLSTMDILTGEMRKEYNELMKQGKDMTDFNNRQAQEEMKRTAFLLGEAENAYSTTIDRVMDDMRQKGMTAWADWLSADPKLQEALMAQLRSTYDSIQDAIKKEASQLKKQAEIMWNNILMPDGKTTLKQQTDRVIAQLGLDEGRVKRANSLIGAGQASERVADKLAIQQMKIQLAMQEHYYNLMKKQGQAHVDMLNAQAKTAKERGDEEEATRKTLDAQHAQMSLNLATAKEETELAKQREDIIARTEESQNRLYTELKSWADLLSSSLQSVFEASHAGDAEYYNERAKMNLTGKGGPGAGTYIVIDNEGTEDATAHYEYLNERQALERQHEIERENAQAEAWKKVMDDINMKMSEQITDWFNASLQQQALDMNTSATNLNTEAINGLSEQMVQGIKINSGGDTTGAPADTTAPVDNGFASDKQAYYEKLSEQNATAETSMTFESTGDFAADRMAYYDMLAQKAQETAQAEIQASNEVKDTIVKNTQKQGEVATTTDTKMTKSNSSMFAKMVSATNMYGAAYQAMSNENLDASQKFQMITLQGIGSMAMAGLEVLKSEMIADAASKTPGVLGKLWSQLGWAAAPVFAIFTGLLGGLMGLATSKVAKSKSQIASVTGASVGAGRLATGMLTYAEGNVNEFTDPGSLTPGRHYNVDGADGRTYRARYMGTNPKTHLTNGPEFHLSGEKGREMIIDAGTTRQITMNDNEIWHTIKTLSGGGRMSTMSRRGRGIRAFADGNVGDFEEVESTLSTGSASFDPEMLAGFQQSLDRNSAIMEQIAANGIEAFVSPYGPRGIVAGYDKGKKEAMSHGEKYL